MGALIIEYKGKRLELSGFNHVNDNERELTFLTNAKTKNDPILKDVPDSIAKSWAKQNLETECPANIINPLFPIGSTITFKYRGLSKDGIPQEAAYWRKDDRF